MSLLGIDLGTSGVRSGVYTEQGEELASCAARLELESDGNRVELDPNALLQAVQRVVRETMAFDVVRSDPPAALALSVQGEAVVPLNDQGQALANAPVSMDRRGEAVLEPFSRLIGAEVFQQVTGQPFHPMFSIFKIAADLDGSWSKPGTRYACLDTFLALQLGAPHVTDSTMAARTGAYDVEGRTWSTKILQAIGESSGVTIDAASLPQVVEPGDQIGAVSSEAAKLYGLPAGIPIVAGAHDQAASWFGIGGAAGGPSAFALGTSDCLTFGTPGRPGRLTGTGLATYPFRGDTWVTLAGTAAGGWALEWLAGLLKEPVADLFDDLPEAPSPVLVLPYFTGSGTLDNDPSARAVLSGLTLETTRGDLAKASVEAAGFELAKILSALEERDLHLGSIVATGGGASNAAALQARSDAAGRQLAAYLGQASVRGAAQLAGIGVGLLELPIPAKTTVPQPLRNQEWYAGRRSAYVELYSSLRHIEFPDNR